jgi:hypothetical protein
MSEARIRSLAQNSSKIFSNSQPDRVRQRENPQSQSKIFKPLQFVPKRMTYAKAQYEKSTIFLGKERTDYENHSPEAGYKENLSPAGKRTGQQGSTKYLIGNERSTFYKKSINENLGVPEQFEPKYSKESAFERKQKEFNSGFSPIRKDEEEQQASPCMTARERKMKDSISIFDRKVFHPEVKPREIKENIKPDYDPRNRKAENFSSEVFETRKLSEYKKPLEVRENDDDRRKNHMFSDLFGRASSPQREKVKERLIPTEHYFAANGRQNLDYDPSQQTGKNLSSNIGFGEQPSRLERNRPKTPQVFKSTSNSGVVESLPNTSKTAELYDLDLFSVPSQMTSACLKEICGGVHVVSLSLDIDNFTGLCKGTGRMKLRLNDISDLSRVEKVFKSRGIQVKAMKANLGRKSNYSEISNVSWHHPYDYKKSTTPLGARESKMRNLESTVFEGQVKWTDRQVESFQDELSAQLLWHSTKNGNKGSY